MAGRGTYRRGISESVREGGKKTVCLTFEEGQPPFGLRCTFCVASFIKKQTTLEII
ncbi:hypothetical protein Hanom_Chr08g00703531 [Helianthus anomalus]